MKNKRNAKNKQINPDDVLKTMLFTSLPKKKKAKKVPKK
jgi:hypothetical protein